MAAAGRIDPTTAAQIGRILSADAIVLGAITRYNLGERRSGTSVLGIGGNSRRNTAEVQLSARLVNTTTAEIRASAEGTGAARQGSGGISIGGIFSHGTSSDTRTNYSAKRLKML